MMLVKQRLDTKLFKPATCISDERGTTYHELTSPDYL